MNNNISKKMSSFYSLPKCHWFLKYTWLITMTHRYDSWCVYSETRSILTAFLIDFYLGWVLLLSRSIPHILLNKLNATCIGPPTLSRLTHDQFLFFDHTPRGMLFLGGIYRYNLYRTNPYLSGYVNRFLFT